MLAKKNPPFRVAISGKSGCGVTTVGTLVAQKLGLILVNYTFRTLAKDRGVSFEEVCRRAGCDDAWDREVDRIQVEKANEGPSVVGSRLAVWLVKNSDLRIFLTASPTERARRIQQREGGSLEERRRETDLRDERDRRRFKKIYGIDNDAYDFVDLVIRTDAFDEVVVSEMIVRAARVVAAHREKKLPRKEMREE